MYAEFHGGYIVPCELIKRMPGWALVRLRPLEPYDHLSWTQTIRLSQLLTEQEVSAG